jgi:hypothetical protein
MCRVRNDDLTAADIADLLAIPHPTLGDLFLDPAVRERIGEWISQAMNRPRRRRKRRNVQTRGTRQS